MGEYHMHMTRDIMIKRTVSSAPKETMTRDSLRVTRAKMLLTKDHALITRDIIACFLSSLYSCTLLSSCLFQFVFFFILGDYTEHYPPLFLTYILSIYHLHVFFCLLLLNTSLHACL